MSSEARTGPAFATWCIHMAQWQAEGYEALYQWQRVYERNRPREGKHVAPMVSRLWVGDESTGDFTPSNTGRFRRALLMGSAPVTEPEVDSWGLGDLLELQESQRGTGEPETLDTRTEFTGH